MEQTPQTSFIPKQTIGVAKNRQRQSLNIFTVIAMVVFLAILTLSVGVFFYARYSESELAIQKAKLADFHEKFAADAEENIEEIRILERRFKVAGDLLDQHVALSKVFDALEDRTQESAQFTAFEFTRAASGNAKILLDGSAASFNTVALQERQLTQESSFDPESVIFSDFNTTPEGDVIFTAMAAVDTRAVAYTAEPQQSGATTTATSTTSTSTSTTSTVVPSAVRATTTTTTATSTP